MQRTLILSRQVAPTPIASATEAYDIIIRNGTIIDGLRTPRFVSDIGIRSKKVATIGRISKDAACHQGIDATGLNVCPGFVDLHTHYDAQIFWDPYCTLSGWHGVTSLVIGNCGFGYAPCQPQNRARYMKAMERNEAVPYEAQEKGMPWDWVTFPEYLDSVDRTPKGVNILSYCGLAPIMIDVMGLETAKKRGATKEEMDKMKQVLREAMEAGACGFSAQVLGETSIQRDYDGTPMVTDTMSKEDLYGFGSVLADLGRGFMQITGTTRKVSENLCKVSGRPLIWNVVSPEGVDQHGAPKENHMRLLRWMDEMNLEKGLRVYGQAITSMALEGGTPFSLDIWNLFDQSPAWRKMTLGSVEERMAKMRDTENRDAARDEYEKRNGRTTAVLGLDLKNLILHKGKTEETQKWEGMKVREIAEKLGQHPVDAFLNLSLDDKLLAEWKTAVKPTNMQELLRVANSPYCLPGVSDGGAHTKFNTGADYTTDFLANLCRDNDAMSLEDCHWRLSQYPAQAAGMEDRGHISVGMPADILVYDLKALRMLPEEVSYDFPGGEWRRTKRAEGYKYTIVNGEVTFEGNRCTGATPGVLLRHGKAVM